MQTGGSSRTGTDAAGTVRGLLDRLRETPFPEAGTDLGDFALYDALLAGAATSYLVSGALGARGLPAPDEATVLEVARLRVVSSLTKPQRDLLAYYDLLQALAQALARACGREA